MYIITCCTESFRHVPSKDRVESTLCTPLQCTPIYLTIYFTIDLQFT